MLLELRQAWPEVRGLELAMATGTRSRAGQFVLTPEQAELLASGGTTPAELLRRQRPVLALPAARYDGGVSSPSPGRAR